MIKYEIYRPGIASTVVESKEDMTGVEIAQTIGGAYVNVSHIKKFKKLTKGCSQILIRDSHFSHGEDLEENDLFPGAKGTVILVKGFCDV